MSGVRVRPVADEHIPQVEVLLEEGFEVPPDRARAYFDMWWRKNPSKRDDIPGGWVLETGGGEVSGFMGNIPVPFQVGGRREIAVGGTSFYVRPAARGLPSLQLVKALVGQKNVGLILNTTAAEGQDTLFKRFGFSEVSSSRDDMEYWLLRDLARMGDFALSKGLVPTRWTGLAKLGLVPLRLGSPLARLVIDWKSGGGRQGRYACVESGECDESFDALWDKSRDRSSTTLWRDRETLNWLCFSDAVRDKRHLIQCIDTQTSELIGFFVFDVEKQERGRLMRLIEAYVPHADEAIVGALLDFVGPFARSHRVAGTVLASADPRLDRLIAQRVRVRRRHPMVHLLRYVDAGPDHGAYVPSALEPDRGTL